MLFRSFFSPDDLRALLEKLGKVSPSSVTPVASAPVDDRAPVEAAKEDNEEIYSLKNFSV